MWIVNRPKGRFTVWQDLLSIFNHCTEEYHLQVDKSAQRKAYWCCSGYLVMEAHLICLFDLCHTSISYYFVCLVYDIFLMWAVIFCFLFSVQFLLSIYLLILSLIFVFNNTNLKKWNEHNVLSCIDPDLVLWMEHPTGLTV